MLDDVHISKGDDYYIDTRVYLIQRGYFFTFVGLFGIFGLIMFLCFRKKDEEK